MPEDVNELIRAVLFDAGCAPFRSWTSADPKGSKAVCSNCGREIVWKGGEFFTPTAPILKGGEA